MVCPCCFPPFAFACLGVLACMAELRSFTVALLRRKGSVDRYIYR